MNKTNLFIIVLMAMLTSLFLFLYKDHLNSLWQKRFYPAKEPVVLEQPEDRKQPWMVVFVHGTFASPFGLLNVYNTLNDEVRGTWYHRIAKKIRRNPMFYEDQVILGRGLHPITPTYDVSVSREQKLAAYPLIQAYKDVHELVDPDKEHHYFYTFGWSGLLSQKVRQFESIRLYNALAKELERFAQQGIRPKIRLISHSHGGNLILNLALINEVLSYGIENVPAGAHMSDPNRNASLRRMQQMMASLNEYDKARDERGNKRWDYKPLRQHITIDEFISFGCPIQPETAHCIDKETFRRVYNFYSDEDIIQRLDWISTRHISVQRFDEQYVNALTSDDGSTGLYQIRLMQERQQLGGRKAQAGWLGRIKQRVFDVIAFFIRQTKDPTHKEMWFLLWDGEDTESLLSPMPTMVLTELLHKIVSKHPQRYDIDVNIIPRENVLEVSATEHEGDQPYDSVSLPASAIRAIKQEVLKWRPADYSPQTRFKIIESYTQEG